MSNKKSPQAEHRDLKSTRLSKKDDLGPNCEVGSKLRALYASIRDETVPDRFIELLEKLDQAELNAVNARGD